MVTAQHSFTAATITAHRDAWAAIQAMPQLALIVGGVMVLQAVLEVSLTDRIIPRNSLFGHDILSIPRYALLTPYFIAVHRFVLLGEVTHRYRLQWDDRRFQLFFGWAFTMFVLSRLALLDHALPHHWMFHFLAFVAAATFSVLFTRITIMFPAIAVDAPRADPWLAFEDTKGHGWYIFFLFLIPFIPSVLLVVIARIAAAVIGSLGGYLLLMLLVSLAGIVWLTMAIVIASRLYQWLGNRLNEPA
jgi:hypothetical protein